MVDKMVWESLKDYSNQCGKIDLTKSENDRADIVHIQSVCSIIK